MNEIEFREFEELCIHCGGCCGSFDGDPCEHLQRDDDGIYFCNIYNDRLGIHHTVGGREMECVPIMDKLTDEWIGDHICTYKRKYLNKK